MQPTLLAQGMELLVYGMGTVVVFLTLLVFATGGMSRLVQRYFPEPVTPPKAPAPAPAAAAGSIPAERLAVIAAAVHRYRQDHHA